MFDTYDQAGVYLGVLDTVFMICYSAGLYLSGWIGERVEVYLHDAIVLRILQYLDLHIIDEK